MFNYLNKRRKRGQSTLEYAILIIVIIGALISIQTYIKRAVQGRLQSASDDIGDQFSRGNTNEVRIMRTQAFTSDTFKAGVTKSTLLNNEITDELMNKTIQNAEFEFWG